MESYSESEAAPPVFDLSGGHPALDLVNTLDDRFAEAGPVELLADYGGLLRFAQQTGLLHPRQGRLLMKSVRPQAAAGALRSARELREALAAAFYASLAGRPPPDPECAPSSGISSLRSSIGSCSGRKRRRATGNRGWHGSGVGSRRKRNSRCGFSRSRQRSSCCRTRCSGCAPAGRTAVAGCFSTQAKITRVVGAI